MDIHAGFSMYSTRLDQVKRRLSTREEFARDHKDETDELDFSARVMLSGCRSRRLQNRASGFNRLHQ